MCVWLLFLLLFIIIIIIYNIIIILLLLYCCFYLLLFFPHHERASKHSCEIRIHPRLQLESTIAKACQLQAPFPNINAALQVKANLFRSNFSMSSTNTRYKQIAYGDSNESSFGTNSTRWPSYDSRWDDPNRVLCLAAGAYK